MKLTLVISILSLSFLLTTFVTCSEPPNRSDKNRLPPKKRILERSQASDMTSTSTRTNKSYPPCAIIVVPPPRRSGHSTSRKNRSKKSSKNKSGGQTYSDHKTLSKKAKDPQNSCHGHVASSRTSNDQENIELIELRRSVRVQARTIGELEAEKAQNDGSEEIRRAKNINNDQENIVSVELRRSVRVQARAISGLEAEKARNDGPEEVILIKNLDEDEEVLGDAPALFLYQGLRSFSMLSAAFLSVCLLPLALIQIVSAGGPFPHIAELKKDESVPLIPRIYPQRLDHCYGLLGQKSPGYISAPATNVARASEVVDSSNDEQNHQAPMEAIPSHPAHTDATFSSEKIQFALRSKLAPTTPLNHRYEQDGLAALQSPPSTAASPSENGIESAGEYYQRMLRKRKAEGQRPHRSAATKANDPTALAASKKGDGKHVTSASEKLPSPGSKKGGAPSKRRRVGASSKKETISEKEIESTQSESPRTMADPKEKVADGQEVLPKRSERLRVKEEEKRKQSEERLRRKENSKSNAHAKEKPRNTGRRQTRVSSSTTSNATDSIPTPQPFEAVPSSFPPLPSDIDDGVWSAPDIPVIEQPRPLISLVSIDDEKALDVGKSDANDMAPFLLGLPLAPSRAGQSAPRHLSTGYDGGTFAAWGTEPSTPSYFHPVRPMHEDTTSSSTVSQPYFYGTPEDSATAYVNRLNRGMAFPTVPTAPPTRWRDGNSAMPGSNAPSHRSSFPGGLPSFLTQEQEAVGNHCDDVHGNQRTVSHSYGSFCRDQPPPIGFRAAQSRISYGKRQEESHFGQSGVPNLMDSQDSHGWASSLPLPIWPVRPITDEQMEIFASQMKASPKAQERMQQLNADVFKLFEVDPKDSSTGNAEATTTTTTTPVPDSSSHATPGFGALRISSGEEVGAEERNHGAFLEMLLGVLSRENIGETAENTAAPLPLETRGREAYPVKPDTKEFARNNGSDKRRRLNPSQQRNGNGNDTPISK